MVKKPDGGFVYPQSKIWNAAYAEYEDTEQHPGMTLRDYFAGQVLVGLTTKKTSNPILLKTIAILAYEMADAMIAEREK